MAKDGGGGKRSTSLGYIAAGLAAGAGILGAAYGAWQNYKVGRDAGYNIGQATGFALSGRRVDGSWNKDATASVWVPLVVGGGVAIGVAAVTTAIPQNVKRHELRIGHVRIGA